MTTDKNIPNAWCPLPWNHVSIKNNGVFRVCCHANSAKSTGQGTLLDENNEPYLGWNAEWDEVRNSSLMREIRKDMLEGKWNHSCIRCEREFKSGMTSRNIYERENWSITHDYAKNNTNDDGYIPLEKFPIEFVDLRPGLKCNLKCLMCGPTDSNQWWTEYALINDSPKTISFRDTHGKEVLYKQNDNTWKPKTDRYEWLTKSDHGLNQLIKNAKYLKRIYLVGGEPLIMEEHYLFLQYLIDEKLAHNIEIEYNSNLTIIPKKAWNIWPHFKQIRIGVSIDAIGEVNNLIRYPSKWSILEKNLDKIDVAEGNFTLWLTATVQALNAFSFADLILWKLKKNYKRINNGNHQPILTPHPLHNPTYLNIQILPKNLKIQVKEYYQNCKNIILKENFSDNQKKSATKIFDTYTNFMYKQDFYNNEWENFLNYMNKMDTIRHTNWKKIIPELGKYA